jgi:C-terminal processing protease CtpA/Prc
VALYRWAEAAREETRLLDAISMAQASPDGSVVAYLRDSRIERLGGGKALSLRDAGVTFDAQLEWDSLFHLAWSLQRDFFWDADRVTGDAWLAKRELYRPLTSCLATRGDCSDLLWQLNGELETSHSYEFRRDDDQAAGEEKAKAFAAETVAKYGEWQANNRALAARLSSGRIGYVHLPSTQPAGYAEFHRQFLREHGKDALILDLRYCAGGNLGEFVLDRLVRRRLGRTKTRGLREEPYPPLSGPARLAVLINGFCGSDGEMLAQAIRTLGMALVFGTPSWGGVTGAKGRTDIVGGGYLSQPRTVFQIENAPRIENRGVIPDKHVEFRPQDYESGIDPQLELAVRELAIWSS